MLGFTMTWNFSGTSIPEKTRMMLPQYMIDLYNQYADDRMTMPMVNMVRSFRAQDIFLSSLQKNCTYSHIFQFNISIPKQEEVTKAELILKTTFSNWGVEHLRLFEVVHKETSRNSETLNSLLASKDVRTDESVTIDVTETVNKWTSTKKKTQKLELSLNPKTGQDSCNQSRMSDILFDSSYQPILIVFSDHHGNQLKEMMEPNQMILHEQKNILDIYYKNNSASHTEVRRNVTKGRSRLKRSTVRDHCKKVSLMVNFKDIGWDNIIIYPPSYDAGQCVGRCYYPLTDNVTPTKHAIIQSLMHIKKPKDVGSVCCVPTKLESLQVVYKEDRKSPVIKKNYEGMKVVECGCR
ncbi:dorsalin-1-like [Hyperolius riggenbachi]|uniref:dorsalin-1-like n=1 Tax=Hyperolius riggenbachi TaxID=752182 RepID=UPI0035A3068A